MNWTVSGNEIRWANGNSTCLPYPVEDVAETAGILVVLLRVPADEQLTENVFGISDGGNVLWQIDAHPSTATDPNNCYMEFVSRGSHTVRIANWNGVVVDVDASTGKIVTQKIGK